jgi:uncharacterized membrane protein (DUF106 family)
MRRVGRRRGGGVDVVPTDFLVDLLKTVLAFILGTLLSAIITGLLINRFVIKKIMENGDVQDIVKLIRDTKDEIMKHNENGKAKEVSNPSS